MNNSPPETPVTRTEQSRSATPANKPFFDTALTPTGPDFSLPLGTLVNNAVNAASQSKHTRRAYRQSIGQFFVYLSAALDISPALAEASKEGRSTIWAYRGTAEIVPHISPSLFDGFRAWLTESGASINAMEARYSAVKTFLGVCYRDGYLADEQARRMDVKAFRPKLKRDTKPVGRRLAREEVQRLRDEVDTDTLKGKRDIAILDCMLFAGLRAEEVATLIVDCIRQENGRYWLTFTGKGNKTRRVKMPDTLYKSLSAWLQAAGKAESDALIFEGVSRHGYLSGHVLYATTASRIVTEYGVAAGLAPATGSNRLSAHDLRRTAARNAHDNGASLLQIQKMLGHADPKTTAHYIGLDEDDDDTATDYIRY